MLYVTREDWAQVQHEFERLAGQFDSLKVQLLRRRPVAVAGADSRRHRCRQSPAGRIRPHRPTTARAGTDGAPPALLAVGLAGRACRRRRRCRFIRPITKPPRSTGKSRSCFLRPCPPRHCRIRAARCSRGSTASAAPARARNIFLRTLQALSGAVSVDAENQHRCAELSRTIARHEGDRTEPCGAFAAVAAGRQARADGGNPILRRRSTPGVEAHMQVRAAGAKAHR